MDRHKDTATNTHTDIATYRLNRPSVPIQWKCYTMVFTWSRKYDFHPEFSLGDSELLAEKQKITLLGVKVQSSLRWDSQVQHMVTKASKTVWTIRRMKAVGVDTVTLREAIPKDFQRIGPKADSFYKSRCPYVCVSVCLSVTPRKPRFPMG